LTAQTRTTFTPGPWHITGIDEDTTVAAVNIYGNNVWVADTFAGAHDLKECESNARIIAAAPEMYEALTNMLVAFVENDPLGTTYFGARGFATHQARAVLARADGR